MHPGCFAVTGSCQEGIRKNGVCLHGGMRERGGGVGLVIGEGKEALSLLTVISIHAEDRRLSAPTRGSES